LRLHTLALGLVDVFRGSEALFFQLNCISLQSFDVLDLSFNFGTLLCRQHAHVHFGVLSNYALFVLNSTLLVWLATRLLKNIVNLFLDGLVDLSLTLGGLGETCVTFSTRIQIAAIEAK